MVHIKKILYFCDVDHEQQSFIWNALLKIRAHGIEVRTVYRITSEKTCPYDSLFNGYSAAPQLRFRHYLLYPIIKVMGGIWPGIGEFISSYANWSVEGRANGTANAVRALVIAWRIKRWRPELIHVHFGWNLAYALPIARLLHLPVVCTLHGSDVYLTERWRRELRDPGVKRVLCVSKAIQRYIERDDGVIGAKSSVLYNPINPCFFDEPRAPPESMHIVMIAAFRALKNHAWLLRSMAVLAHRHIDVTCTLIGAPFAFEPEQFRDIQDLAEVLGLSAMVKFPGWLSSEHVMKEIDECTVLALTSKSEGMGMVIAEALARQRTPVATDLPGPREAMGNGVYGKLVSVDDDEKLADALMEAHRKTVGHRSLMEAGRRFAADNFNPDCHFRALKEVYLSILDK